ncbi:MAG: DUF3788 family protein [Bacteroidales bacterium]|nr:DUF3788 family protein [Bacteroidales bacterium]
MEELIFVEKGNVPNELTLTSALSESYKYYSEILNNLRSIKPGFKTEWKYYGKKNGWLLKHIDKKKNMFFLVPYQDSFKLSFTFGDKALTEILASEIITEDLKEQIRTSKKYTEGTSIFFSINSMDEALQAIELIKFKLSC